MSDRQVSRLLTRAKAAWQSHLIDIAKASQSGSQRRVQNLVRHFMRNGLCKIAAMATNRKMKRHRLSDRALIKNATTLSLWHPCRKPVDLHGIRKPGGRYRYVSNFGLYACAGQLIL